MTTGAPWLRKLRVQREILSQGNTVKSNSESPALVLHVCELAHAILCHMHAHTYTHNYDHLVWQIIRLVNPIFSFYILGKLG